MDGRTELTNIKIKINIKALYIIGSKFPKNRQTNWIFYGTKKATTIFDKRGLRKLFVSAHIFLYIYSVVNPFFMNLEILL